MVEESMSMDAQCNQDRFPPAEQQPMHSIAVWQENALERTL